MSLRLIRLLLMQLPPMDIVLRVGASTTIVKTDSPRVLANTAALMFLALVVCRSYMSLMDADTHEPAYRTLGSLCVDPDVDSTPVDMLNAWYQLLYGTDLLCPDAASTGHMVDRLPPFTPNTTLVKYVIQLEVRFHSIRHELQSMIGLTVSKDVQKLLDAMHAHCLQDYETSESLQRPPGDWSEEDLRAGIPIPLGMLPPELLG